MWFYRQIQRRYPVQPWLLPAAVFFLLAAVLSCQSAAASETEEDKNAAFTAIITSDLHYTDQQASGLVIPCMERIEEITDALVAQVIDLHPDVFIMTGDNTNSGAVSSEKALARKLSRITDAGIPVVLTTGNHDFNSSAPEDFRQNFQGLCEVLETDPSSLSYVTQIGPVVLFAMDDSSLTLGREGRFSPGTIAWLEEMLEKYREYPVFFLTHHNVILGKEDSSSGSYHIQNPELLPLLLKKQVQLILSGHLHAQIITEEKGLHEIISSMPVSGNHRFGMLQIRSGKCIYQTQELDFETYGGGELARQVEELDAGYGDYYRDAVAVLIENSGYPEAMRRRMLELLKKIVVSYTDGTVFEHKKEILSDPAFDPLVEVLWDANYGPWIRSSVEGAKISSSELTFDLSMEKEF